MSETELTRLQLQAAFDYINRAHSYYKLDRKSCRFFARLLNRKQRHI